MQLNKPTGEAAESLPAFDNQRNLQPGKEPVTVKSGLILEVGTLRGQKQSDNQNDGSS